MSRQKNRFHRERRIIFKSISSKSIDLGIKVVDILVAGDRNHKTMGAFFLFFPHVYSSFSK
jgi:hypothetical protein